MGKDELTYELEKEYKSVYRYKETTEGKAPIVPYIYIKKYAFTGKPPTQIIVTINY